MLRAERQAPNLRFFNHYDMAPSRKRIAVAAEGPEAARRFERAVTRVLSVSKEELAEREAAYQKSRAHKDRPGPRPRRSR